MAQYRQQKRFSDNEKGFQPDEELSDILTKLWEMDENKLIPEKDFSINLQSSVSFHARGDRSRWPLFDHFDEEGVFAKGTFDAFSKLLNNYEMECGEAEVVTREEIMENRTFINAIMETKVMQECHKYLIAKGKAKEDIGDFKCQLYNLWFVLFRRTRGDRDKDSSSFEHVFVGEYRDQEFIGLHNWLQIYLLEKAGKIDYHGYLKRDTIKDDSEQRLLALQFTYHDEEDGPMEKPVCSTFLGTSPEFEIAAYTILFFTKQGKTDVQLGEYEVEVACYPLQHRYIGTAYIAAAKM
ncbi:poly(U)-specific endoribonuclease-A-like [Ruditapes philippinarum]|uniref:poly(U)-specific endoribonuclease-A-like n=1 Tax=Ruditapes philippinarum TaxID=129788 RepID=UPI00295B92B5|nr:poly(U)-specific endoribonuclease-A-like [Ruditapes philippinarum]